MTLHDLSVYDVVYNEALKKMHFKSIIKCFKD